MSFLRDYASDMLWITLAIVLLAWVGLKKTNKNLNAEDPSDEELSPRSKDSDPEEKDR